MQRIQMTRHLIADTPDTTYHIEFRYGYTEYKINSFYDGDYAYWMASGIKTDASEDVIMVLIFGRGTDESLDDKIEEVFSF